MDQPSWPLHASQVENFAEADASRLKDVRLLGPCSPEGKRTADH